MQKIKLRIGLLIVSLAAFFGPFGAVVAHERNKRSAELAMERKTYLAEQLETEQNRQAYFESVDAKRAEMRTYMEEEKRKYEMLLASQKEEVARHQHIATRTKTQTVVKKQSVQVAAKSSGSSSSQKTSASPSAKVTVSAPVAATKTKTS
jgi:hypothetical protein